MSIKRKECVCSNWYSENDLVVLAYVMIWCSNLFLMGDLCISISYSWIKLCAWILFNLKSSREDWICCDFLVIFNFKKEIWQFLVYKNFLKLNKTKMIDKITISSYLALFTQQYIEFRGPFNLLVNFLLSTNF